MKAGDQVFPTLEDDKYEKEPGILMRDHIALEVLIAQIKRGNRPLSESDIMIKDSYKIADDMIAYSEKKHEYRYEHRP